MDERIRRERRRLAHRLKTLFITVVNIIVFTLQIRKEYCGCRSQRKQMTLAGQARVTGLRPGQCVVKVRLGSGDLRRTKRWAVEARLLADGGQECKVFDPLLNKKIDGPGKLRSPTATPNWCQAHEFILGTARVHSIELPRYDTFVTVDVERARILFTLMELRSCEEPRLLLGKSKASTLVTRQGKLGNEVHQWSTVSRTGEAPSLKYRAVAHREMRVTEWMSRAVNTEGYSEVSFRGNRDTRGTNHGQVEVGLDITYGRAGWQPKEIEKQGGLTEEQVARATAKAYVKTLGYATNLRHIANGRILRENVHKTLSRVVSRHCNILVMIAEKFVLGAFDGDEQSYGSSFKHSNILNEILLTKIPATIDIERLEDVELVLEDILSNSADDSQEDMHRTARILKVAVSAVKVASQYEHNAVPSLEDFQENFSSLMKELAAAEKEMVKSNEQLWKAIKETNKMLKTVTEELQSAHNLECERTDARVDTSSEGRVH